MTDNPRLCDECLAIRTELMKACVSKGATTDQASLNAFTAVLSGGSEEDLERAEEFRGEASFGLHERIRKAFLRANLHKLRTGHPLPFGLPFLPSV